MRAIVCRNYGPPEALRLEELPTPSPGPGEVLVEIHAAGLNAADWHYVRGTPRFARLFFGLRRPKNSVPGADVAGRVAALGEGAGTFEVGDAVFGDLSGCGWGALAEYVACPAAALVRIPETVGFEAAAAAPMAGVTALQAVRTKGGLRPGERVLINGASGGVGAYALQLAVALGGAATAVCSARNVEQARELGAQRVIDYSREDFAAAGDTYDLIVAVNGNTSIFDYRRCLRPGGRYVVVGGSGAQVFQAMFLGPVLSRGGRKLGGMLQQPNRDDLATLAELMGEGKVGSVIDRRYSLEEAVEAIRYVEEGHARGKVVVRVRG